MIVRIATEGQYELTESDAEVLNELDNQAVVACESGDETTFATAFKELIDFVRKIKQSGRACIYIEHNLAHVHEVADRLVVLDRGAIVSEGNVRATDEDLAVNDR